MLYCGVIEELNQYIDKINSKNRLSRKELSRCIEILSHFLTLSNDHIILLNESILNADSFIDFQERYSFLLAQNYRLKELLKGFQNQN